MYPEDYLIGIRVIKLRDREGDQGAFEVMRFDKCLIKNVSAVTLSNENTPQIVEFQVDFKTSTDPNINIDNKRG